ncbi:MAG: hypothetical protein JWO36_550 [Myxococcales bacterium]|nr:hypothetical protein [Myxococcales bacterium]
MDPPVGAQTPAPGTTAASPKSSEDQRMAIGLIAGPGFPEKLARYLPEQLPSVLRETFPGTSWKVVIRREPYAGGGADADLVQLARRRMLEEGWNLAVVLTARPLRVGRRPVTAEASAALGVGVISVPALGAVGLGHRLLEAVVLTVEAMLRNREDGDLAKERRSQQHRIEDLGKISSAVGRPFEEAQGRIAFATATAIGNLRLLLGAIRGNRPWALIIGLSHSLVAALGTSAFGLTSPVIWRIANAMHPTRMVLLTTSSLFAIGFTLMVAHSLWERAPTPDARTRVVLINLATSSTVAIGVVTSYITLLSFNYVFGGALIPEAVLQHELGHRATPIEYLRIAWLVSSLATLGGALGAVLESNASVREAAYCMRPVTKRDDVPAQVAATTAAIARS